MNGCVLNIPVYQYNTGRADNGNTVIMNYYEDRVKAASDLTFINQIYRNILEGNNKVDDEKSERYVDFFDPPGHQTDYAFITVLEETKL